MLEILFCCAAALASIRLIEAGRPTEKSARLGAILHQRPHALAGRTPQIGHVVGGRGLMAGVSCVQPGGSEPDGDLAFDIVRLALEKGVLMSAPVGHGAATVKIAPPLDVLEEVFADALRPIAAAAG